MNRAEKQFESRAEAKDEMFQFRRRGFDAFVIGCTLIVVVESWIRGTAEKFAVFGTGWEMLS